MKNKLFTIIFGVAIFIFIISFSIALPIYLRFFYYLQINSFGLEPVYSYSTIKEAYNQIIRYLTLPGGEFSAGKLPFTQSFASHMKDVKVLFMINFFALVFSVLLTTSTLILSKLKKIELVKPFHMSVSFISALSVLGVVLIIAIVVFIDFNSAFDVFHKILFPGKDNWLIDPYVDPTINILPIEYFISCAVLIFASIFSFCIAIIIVQIIKRKKAKTEQNSNKIK